MTLLRCYRGNSVSSHWTSDDGSRHVDENKIGGYGTRDWGPSAKFIFHQCCNDKTRTILRRQRNVE